MKNIHILLTDKPSRLVLNSINNDLFLTTTKKFPSDIMKFNRASWEKDEETSGAIMLAGIQNAIGMDSLKKTLENQEKRKNMVLKFD